MRTKLAAVLTLMMALGVLGGVALAQGPGNGPPSHSQAPHAPAAGDDLSVVAGENTTYDESVSPGYTDADPVDTVTLGEGEWKITATGAVSLDGSVASSLNCGLRTQGDSGPIMIAKQNSAAENQGGRDGFAVVGHLEVEDEQDVELVCYGAGTTDNVDQPFEHNLVAVGG